MVHHTDKKRNKKTATKKAYPGSFPSIPNRGYFKQGDGFNVPSKNIKRIQKFLNWAIGAKLMIDGKYGQKTLTAAKNYKK